MVDGTPSGEELAWKLILERAGEKGHPRVAGDYDDPTFGVGGQETTQGLESARELMDLFRPLVTVPRIVVGQLGQSLDGRIATEGGRSHYITGEEDRRRLHRVRAVVDAVIVGASTAEADDPRLTVRAVPGPQPVRVLVDPRGRVRPSAALLQDGAAPTLWIRRDDADPPAPHVEVVTLSANPAGRFEPDHLLAALRERRLDRILVEGGGTTVSRFLEAGALDRLHVTVAPLLMGSGRPAVTLPPIDDLAHALRPPTRVFRLGEDVLFDLDLRASRPRPRDDQPHPKDPA